jgi:DNA replication protein DnaC
MAESDVRSSILGHASELRLDAFIDYEKAIESSASAEGAILALLEEQGRIRRDRLFARRVKAAGFPNVKTMDTFERSRELLPELDFGAVSRLEGCGFIREAIDVAAVGPAGMGKTHIATGIGVRACELGYSVMFRSAHGLAGEMAAAESEGRLPRLIKKLSRPHLLIIDDMGLLSLDPAKASLLFQVIDARHGKRSVFYTASRKFSEWGQLMGGELAAAMLDRIAHRSCILRMNGPKSYRLVHSLGKGAADGVLAEWQRR